VYLNAFEDPAFLIDDDTSSHATITRRTARPVKPEWP